MTTQRRFALRLATSMLFVGWVLLIAPWAAFALGIFPLVSFPIVALTVAAIVMFLVSGRITQRGA